MPTTKKDDVTVIGVGIDTARYSHRVNFLRPDLEPAARAYYFEENRDGYDKFKRTLEKLHKRHPAARFNVRLDVAGQYARNLEVFIRELKLPVSLSVGEPKRNKDYHDTFFPKRTSDDTESKAAARFAVVEKPEDSLGIPEEFQLLVEVANRLQAKVRDTTRCVNRLHNILSRAFPEFAESAATDLRAAWVLNLLKKYPTAKRIATAQLKSLKQQRYMKDANAEKIHNLAKKSVAVLCSGSAEILVQSCVTDVQDCLNAEENLEKLLIQLYLDLPEKGQQRLATIPGIGLATAAILTAKIVSIDRFKTAKNLVGYFGIFPTQGDSGVSKTGEPKTGNKANVTGKNKMSKKGSDLVRKYLWNAAKSAIVHNAPISAMYNDMKLKGKRGDVALGHCMRKLLHQVFAVWVGNCPYDEDKAFGPTPRRPQAPQTEPVSEEKSEEKNAAGHKQDINLQEQVVTAAQPSLSQVASQHNQAGSIDYKYLREQISIDRVLGHFGLLKTLRGSGAERKGPCPFHAPANPHNRDFSVNLEKGLFNCHSKHCNAKGNVLDFWVQFTQQELHPAAFHMAETFGLKLNQNTEKRRP